MHCYLYTLYYTVHCDRPPSAPQREQQQQQQGGMNGGEIANCTSLYVKNVDIMTTDSDLRKAFDQFGPIQSIALRCDRGFAFVYYHTPEPVHAAIKARSEGKVSFFPNRLFNLLQIASSSSL
jgi:RNA recognition motif-containing protein